MAPLALFTWGRVPNTDAQVATWGHYAVFVRSRSTGTWELALYHRSRRTRHAERPGDLPLAEVRAEAEGWLLDEQGPEIRELVRRTQAAQSAGAGTRPMRAHDGVAVTAGAASGKRRHAGAAGTSKRRRAATHIQSLLFPASTWTAERAQAWAKRHGYQYRDVDVPASGRYIHLRQRHPAFFSKLRTICLGGGCTVKAVVGPLEVRMVTLGGGKRRAARSKHTGRAKHNPSSRLAALVANINAMTR